MDAPRRQRQRARTRDEITADGTSQVTLSNEGAISLISVAMDGVEMDLTDITVQDNVLNFPVPPDEGSDLIVQYAYTRYSSDQILQFLADAAITIQGDVNINWQIDRAGGRLTIADADLLTAPGTDLLAIFQKLLVYRASLDMVADKANQAADDAILIREGDTTMDTSKTAGSTENAVKRLQDRYQQALTEARKNRFRGQVMDHSQSNLIEPPLPGGSVFLY